ncbi:MAG: hypothetical protein IJC51_03245 [Eggerthellaceae bacterium]|nr:hypothetical protein [Eggerthellaceae bacterium]
MGSPVRYAVTAAGVWTQMGIHLGREGIGSLGGDEGLNRAAETAPMDAHGSIWPSEAVG